LRERWAAHSERGLCLEELSPPRGCAAKKQTGNWDKMSKS
jgi:hypothetical protein